MHHGQEIRRPQQELQAAMCFYESLVLMLARPCWSGVYYGHYLLEKDHLLCHTFLQESHFKTWLAILKRQAFMFRSGWSVLFSDAGWFFPFLFVNPQGGWTRSSPPPSLDFELGRCTVLLLSPYLKGMSDVYKKFQGTLQSTENSRYRCK